MGTGRDLVYTVCGTVLTLAIYTAAHLIYRWSVEYLAIYIDYSDYCYIYKSCELQLRFWGKYLPWTDIILFKIYCCRPCSWSRLFYTLYRFLIALIGFIWAECIFQIIIWADSVRAERVFIFLWVLTLIICWICNLYLCVIAALALLGTPEIYTHVVLYF